MDIIEKKEKIENAKNNYFLNSILFKFPLLKSTDFWDTFKYLLKLIINTADFLYKVIEPFIIIIFTVLFTINKNLALLFVTFALLLRFLSMIEIDTETLFPYL
jgi:hypothetical protein